MDDANHLLKLAKRLISIMQVQAVQTKADRLVGLRHECVTRTVLRSIGCLMMSW